MVGSCSISLVRVRVRVRVLVRVGVRVRVTSLETSSTMMLEVFRMGKKPKSFLASMSRTYVSGPVYSVTSLIRRCTMNER